MNCLADHGAGAAARPPIADTMVSAAEKGREATSRCRLPASHYRIAQMSRLTASQREAYGFASGGKGMAPESCYVGAARYSLGGAQRVRPSCRRCLRLRRTSAASTLRVTDSGSTLAIDNMFPRRLPPVPELDCSEHRDDAQRCLRRFLFCQGQPAFGPGA
jgi:hypothetical protein